MSEEYLKDSYKMQLYAFLFFNVAVFWILIIDESEWANLSSLIESFTISEGLAGILAPALVLGLNGILSSDMKATIVFWRISNPLPGSRVFSNYMDKDPRIAQKPLRNSFGEFPTNPQDQNRLWYQMYKSVEGELIVKEAHRTFLHARDFCGFSFLYLIVFAPAAALTELELTKSVVYILAIVVQYLIFCVSARHYGIRFATNVLALISSKTSVTSQ